MAEGDSDDAQAARDAARGRLSQVCGLGCKRITNSDDRGGVCFAQLSVRRIEVRGKKKKEKLDAFHSERHCPRLYLCSSVGVLINTPPR